MGLMGSTQKYCVTVRNRVSKMLPCERGIHETVTDREVGISEWTNTLLRAFHSSFQSFSTQKLQYPKFCLSWNTKVYKSQLHGVLSIDKTRQFLDCVLSNTLQLTRAWSKWLSNSALCAELSPHSTYNCTSINNSYLLKPYVNMCIILPLINVF